MQALKMHGGFKPFYPDDIPLLDKVHTTAQSVYGTDVIVAETRVRDRIDRFEPAGGFGVITGNTR